MKHQKTPSLPLCLRRGSPSLPHFAFKASCVRYKRRFMPRQYQDTCGGKRRRISEKKRQKRGVPEQQSTTYFRTVSTGDQNHDSQN
jgi:hypothetical protein